MAVGTILKSATSGAVSASSADPTRQTSATTESSVLVGHLPHTGEGAPSGDRQVTDLTRQASADLLLENMKAKLVAYCCYFSMVSQPDALDTLVNNIKTLGKEYTQTVCRAEGTSRPQAEKRIHAGRDACLTKFERYFSTHHEHHPANESQTYEKLRKVAVEVFTTEAAKTLPPLVQAPRPPVEGSSSKAEYENGGFYEGMDSLKIEEYQAFRAPAAKK